MPSRPGRGLAAVGKTALTHISVFMVLLGVFSLIALWAPLYVRASYLFLLFATVFIIYLGTLTLIQTIGAMLNRNGERNDP